MSEVGARELVALYDERIRLTHEMAQSDRPTGAMAQAVLDKGAELDAACEAFRRQHYPRAGRVVAAFGEVFTVSPAGRKITCVYSERDR